ncbi:AAA family ATPase [Methanobacterium sp.]|uniref:ATP-dependent nuclease n=1 Tax=Methanobacterium sp. TaxID=2164 RepID=UPI0025F52220|nr:AAA family ATPase [Methanobacterium sp.]MBI5458831.1 ATP-dependent endonuclease [Methanobacterium sp.]
MYLSSLKIQNYRSLRDVKIPLSPFVCIIGENNCGKSSTLLGLSLFINGTNISKKEFHNSSLQIRIEVDLNGITESDLERISEEHRKRIINIMDDDKLTLIRIYDPSGTTNVYYKGVGPKNEKLIFDILKKSKKLKGKKGKELQEFMKNYLEDYKDNFNEVKTHKDVENVLEEIINGLSSKELEEKDFLLPTGIWNSLKPLLPDTLLIPAVKNISDDLKTRESATFGKLLGALLSLIEDTDVIKDISESFDKLTGLLNKIKTNEGVVDRRIDEVKYIENVFEKYIQENFPSVTLELMIPPPTLKNIFSGAEVEVNDGVSGPFDLKGDGLKRAITFALLRTYVEVSKTDTISEKKEITPYLFLFEEPELYLHPKAQKILFDALNQISEQHQVIVTTHSPIFFSPEYGGTFIKMKKNDNHSVPCSESCGIHINDDWDELELFRLICFENNNAAFFSDKILLVEGDSDLIFFRHVSKILRENWDFDLKNIPIIKMAGKGNVKRYRDFFEIFGIDVHSILDLDVIVQGFNKLGASEVAVGLQNELMRVIDGIAEQQNISGSPTKEQVKEMTRSYSWVERYKRLKELAEVMVNGYFLKEDEKLEIEYLFSKETANIRKQILKGYDGELKTNLLNTLRDEQIYVLNNGSVESYYPEGVSGKNKLIKAFNACELLTELEQINQLCPQYEIEDSILSEFEIIFSNIFDK